MKVSELLLEKTLIKKSWKVDKVNLQKAINLLNENCKDSLTDIANGVVLWRGMNNIGQVAALDSTGAYRTSKDSNNVYQLAMEASIHMKEIPARSRSFICSNDFYSANSYEAATYAIFPYDGTRIARVERDDVFSVLLPVIHVGISDFSEGFEHDMLNKLKIKANEKGKFTDVKYLDDSLSKYDASIILVLLWLCSDWFTGRNDAHAASTKKTSLQKIINLYNSNPKIVTGKLRRIVPGFLAAGQIVNMYNKNELDVELFTECLLKEISSNSDLSMVFNALANNPNKKFTALSSALMTPKGLDISIVTPGSLTGGDKEHWFSGKCIAVKKSTFFQIIDEMKERKMSVGKSLYQLAGDEYD
jgi:hypothetical protein